MSCNRFAVEAIMDEHQLKHFVREDDGSTSWLLLFEHGSIMIRLIENGEFLIVRSLPVAKLNRLTVEQQNNLLRQLLKRNNELKLGHYSVDNDVVFEAALPIEDSELTSNQLKRCVGVVSHELANFATAFETMCQDRAPTRDSIDQLMERLIHGDETNPESSTPAPPVVPPRLGGLIQDGASQVAPTQEAPSVKSPEETATSPTLTPDLSTGPSSPGQANVTSEASSFSVVLKSFSRFKLEVVKVVKQLTGLTLMESKRLVESAPTMVGRWNTRKQAEEALQKLLQVGATAVIE